MSFEEFVITKKFQILKIILGNLEGATDLEIYVIFNNYFNFILSFFKFNYENSNL